MKVKGLTTGVATSLINDLANEFEGEDEVSGAEAVTKPRKKLQRWKGWVIVAAEEQTGTNTGDVDMAEGISEDEERKEESSMVRRSKRNKRKRV